MAVSLSEDEVLSATAGRRLRPSGRGGFSAVGTDSRALPEGCLFVALEGERFDAHDFLEQVASGGAGGAVVRDGARLPALPDGFGVYAVPDTLAALGALARFHRRRFRIPMGAVGGSNGKTTTKEMVAAILGTRGPALKTEGNLNNEVGVPLTLFRLEPTHVAAVIEMGMNQRGEMTRLANIALPDAAVLTVIQPEHLEGLGSIEGVAEAEGELFRALPPSATAAVNLDDPHLVAQSRGLRSRILTFGRHPEAAVRLLSVEKLGREGLRIRVGSDGGEHAAKLSFLGEHNALNATAAFALGRALGYSAEECAAGLEAARPYARRLNWVDAPGGVTVLDDCYNANTFSVVAALDTVQELARAHNGRAVAVLGDMLELGPGELEEHRRVGERARTAVSLAAFFGPRSRVTHQAAGMGAHFTEIGPLVEWLRPQLRPADVVLVKGSRGMKLERVVEALSGVASGGAH
ncbi:MAG TPA: UDP-N-acetylmuramoyl-tripeptide--D-alanyl-D-alanine ligase [Myxococcaceae bacterium]|nr:UDP-N-acetylmuramoyl-tripeptide--D-alanyl-D-alanine ligase [Myxococcaceae bacterium]